jgi:hypothetical protein
LLKLLNIDLALNELNYLDLFGQTF